MQQTCALMTTITHNFAKLAVIAACVFGQGVLAQGSIPLPVGASETYNDITKTSDSSIAIDVWDGAEVPSVHITGRQQAIVWKSEGASLTLAQISEPILSYFLENGYDIRLDCIASQCGGFDFRHAIQAIYAPDLYIDLRKFRYFSFTKGPKSTPNQAASVLVTHAFGASYVQIIFADKAGETPMEINTTSTVVASETKETSFETTGDVIGDLTAKGRAILADLSYASGSSELTDDTYATLEELATFIEENPDKNVVLVGHSDNIGGLSGNINLAKNRAQSVVDLLVGTYGVSENRLSAEGVGFLSPLTSNDTQDGRDINRRVEAIIAPPK